MHARRPFALPAEDDELPPLGGGEAAAAVLDEEEQDQLVDELKRESAVAIWWTRAGLSAVLGAIASLTVFFAPAHTSALWLGTLSLSLLAAGASLLPLPAQLAHRLNGLTPAHLTTASVALGAVPLAYSLAHGRLWADRLLGPAVGLGLAVVGRRWIDGLEQDVRRLEGKKYALKGA